MFWFKKTPWTLSPIHNIDDLEQRISEVGFLPMFQCGIKGFSVYEATPGFWSDDDGPWEWKGPLIRSGNAVYGKFFNRKAVWISRPWWPHFLNYRRTKHLAPNDDIAALDDIVLQTVHSEGSATAKEISSLLGLSGKRRNKRKADSLPEQNPEQEIKISLNPILARLMMESRIVIADFIYNIDKRGNAYGWGIARYSTPERLYGPSDALCSPQESYKKMFRHLKKILPGASDTQISKLLG